MCVLCVSNTLKSSHLESVREDLSIMDVFLTISGLFAICLAQVRGQTNDNVCNLSLLGLPQKLKQVLSGIQGVFGVGTRFQVFHNLSACSSSLNPKIRHLCWQAMVGTFPGSNFLLVVRFCSIYLVSVAHNMLTTIRAREKHVVFGRKLLFLHRKQSWAFLRKDFIAEVDPHSNHRSPLTEGKMHRADLGAFGPTGDLLYPASHHQHTWLRSFRVLDSTGTGDQPGHERQRGVHWAEFHAVTCQCPSSLAALALPSPRVL